MSYLLQDHLGSTTATVGATSSSQKYYPFGGLRGTSQVSTDKRFTGHQKEGSLYFMQARFYDPAIGRFLQPDTIVPDPSNPQSLNRYSYVLNNPLRYTDPTGHTYNPYEAACSPSGRGCMTGPIGPGTADSPYVIEFEVWPIGRTGTYLRIAPNPWLIGIFVASELCREFACGDLLLERAAGIAQHLPVLGTLFSDGDDESIRELELHPEIQEPGGRSGERVKDIKGPPNSVIKGGIKGRIFVTNDQGDVVLDITPERVKEIVPGVGEVRGSKRLPTEGERRLINEVWK